MGGENAPKKTIQGVSLFIKKNKSNNDFLISLHGDKNKIKQELVNNNIDEKFINIIHSESVISDEESPLTAIKNSKNTSMWNCIKSQIDGDQI